MKKSIIKIFLFVLSIFIFVSIIRYGVYYTIIKNPSYKPYFNSKRSDSICYIIGSSRIRESFDEKLMMRKITGKTFHNMGINALPMNYGLLLANKIISTSKNNIIFIEVSRFKPYKSPRCYDIFNYSDFNKGLISYYNSINKTSYYEFKTFITDIGEFAFNFFSLNEEFNIINDPSLGITNLANSRIEKSYSGDSSNIVYLNALDIESINKNEKFNKTSHIEILKTIANGLEKNTKIIFLLPIAFTSSEEKKELLPLFNSIPEKNKMIYTEKFLTEICQTKNLCDNVHFNINGSFIFSNELTKEINKLNEKNN